MHERSAIPAKGRHISYNICVVMNVVMQVDIAQFHIDVMKTKRTTEPAMAKNVNNVFFPSALIFGALELIDGSHFIFDILTSKRSKGSNYFPCKLLER